MSSLTEKKALLTGLSLVLVATSILESQFLVFKGLTTEVEQGISTILLSLTLFILFMSVFSKGTIPLQMAKIGRQYSTMIYVIHPAFLSLFNLVLQNRTSEPLYRWLLPIIIFTVSYGFSVVYDKVKLPTNPK